MATATSDEALLQEMMSDAKVVDAPSELLAHRALVKGDESKDEAPMVVKSYSSAGYVQIWDSRTFEDALVLYYMLPSLLRRRRKDGSRIWTTNDPGQRPARGTYKCMLHADSPGRETYTEMGLRVCPKSNIRNAHEVRLHMLRKHPREWESLEEMRIANERKEDRDLQHDLIRAVGGKTTEGIALTKEPMLGGESEVGDPLPEARPLGEHEYNCTKCNKVHMKESGIGKRHLKYA